jgi:hypothetical protein
VILVGGLRRFESRIAWREERCGIRMLYVGAPTIEQNVDAPTIALARSKYCFSCKNKFLLV